MEEESQVVLSTLSVAWVRKRTIPTARLRRLSAKLMPTFADIGANVVSVTDPYGCILCFLDRNRYFFFQVAPSCNHKAE
jgi:hypothetical protein